MNCCNNSFQDAVDEAFSAGVALYQKKFKKRGFESSQKLLFEALVSRIKNCDILEIGWGVGILHRELLCKGARSVVGVDIARGMLEAAKRLSETEGMADKTTYLKGDFMELQDTIEVHDIVILDKVICCYNDSEAQVKSSALKARQFYFLSFPRSKWYIQVVIRLIIFFLRLFRAKFHPYIYQISSVRLWLKDQGFKEIYTGNTFIWQVLGFEKKR